VQELSPADELFSNGKIRAKEIKQNVTNPNEVRGSKPVSSCSLPSCTVNTEKKRLKEFLFGSFDVEEKPPSKSFWQFKRSSSLNCDNARSRSLICSLQFLSRSNSTGSAPNSKQTNLSKETQKSNLQKQPSVFIFLFLLFLRKMTSLPQTQVSYHLMPTYKGDVAFH
jgi:hypothetical protein